MNKQLRFLTGAAFAAAATACVYLALRYVLVWLLPFIIALALAAGMEPAIRFLAGKLRLRRGFVAAVLSVLVLGAIVSVLAVLLSGLFQQALRLTQALPQYLAALPEYLALWRQRLDAYCAACPQAVGQWLRRLLAEGGTRVTSWVLSLSAQGLQLLTDGAAMLPGIFLFAGTTALALFFTTASYPGMLLFFRRQLSPRALHWAQQLKQGLLSSLGQWLRAQCILLGITFVELLCAFLLLRQPYALLLAAVIAVIDALPVFGAGTVLLPWCAVCLLLGQVPRAIALAATYGIISMVRSFTEPKVMARQANLPPLAALCAMYIGFCTMGVGGMLLFPLALLLIKQLHESGCIRLWK